MTPSTRLDLSAFALTALMLLALTGLAMGVKGCVGTAYGRSLSGVYRVVLSLTPAYDDRNVPTEVKAHQLAAIADAVENAGRTRLERAMLIELGDAESHFAIEVHEGRCRKPRCDWHPQLGFRARSPWQIWQLGMPEADWSRMVGVDNTRFQAEVAARRIRGALGHCKGSVRGAFAVLGGKPCSGSFRGIDERVRGVERILLRIGG